MNLRNLLFAPPDKVLIEVGAGGEKFAAYTRLYFVIFIWISSIIVTLVMGDSYPENIAITIGATAMLIVACFYVYFVTSKKLRSVSHFLVSISDITLVSFTLFAMAYLGKPELAVNSMVVWEGYLVFILASCLYFDVRVCIVTTLIALVQYGLILWWCTANFDFPINNPDSFVFNGIALHIQISRFLIMIVAAIIAISIILRSRSLLTLSGTDTLTGLPNRRVFEAHLAQELSRAKRHNLKFSIVYMDLDHFKNFNSKWGHDTGDKVLKHVAKAMQNKKRTEDIVARWGGEEFLGLFPNSNKIAISNLTDRLADFLKSGLLPIHDKKQNICFSAGIAEYPTDGTDAASLIRVADERLNRAKANGRDQIVIE